MSGTGTKLASSVEKISTFSGVSLSSKIAELEWEFAQLDKVGVVEKLRASMIDTNLLDAARAIKNAAAQIDVVLHTVGILLLLPNILKDGERIESLSLGAGTSELRRFDLETTLRVAEFTFIGWRGNDNTRLQKVFKDFYRLAEFSTPKTKELWLSDDSYVLKYFRSGTTVRSATHKYRDVWEEFMAKYPNIERVADYYRLHASSVKLRVYDREA